MSKCIIDIETVSYVDLKVVGARKFGASDRTFITIIGFCDISTGEVFTLSRWTPNDDRAIEAFKRLIKGKLYAFNAQFESAVLKHRLKEFLDDIGCEVNELPDLSLTNWFCLQDYSQAMGALGKSDMSKVSLDDVCRYFRLSIQKDKEGNKLVSAVCKGEDEIPKRVKSRIPIDKYGAKWKKFRGGYILHSKACYQRLVEYCAEDVKASLSLYKHLNKLSKDDSFKSHTMNLLKTTQKMNDIGFKVDLELTEKVRRASQAAHDRLNSMCEKLLGCEYTKKARLLKALKNKYDLLIDNVDKNTLGGLKVEDPELKEFFRLYIEANPTVPLAKSKTILKDNVNGVMHDTLLFSSTETGRYSARGVQPQNLPAPTKGYEETLEVFNSPDYLAKCKEDFGYVKSAIRLCIQAREGYKFADIDLAAVEARGFLSAIGRTDLLRKIKEEGYDLYGATAEKVFGKPCPKGTKERDLLKSVVLSLFYGASVQAVINDLSAKIGMNKAMKIGPKIYEEFHAYFPEVKESWAKRENQLLKAYYEGGDLELKLSSGRVINLGRIIKVEDQTRTLDRKRIIWASKLQQNIIQANCRDILAMKMNALAEKYNIILTVHDSILLEVPKDEYTMEEILKDANKCYEDTLAEMFVNMPIEFEGGALLDRYWK